MDKKVEAAINRIQQLQQAFSESLVGRIDELNKTSLKLDGYVSPLTENNRQRIKSTYDLAHKLAGSAGTFQFTNIYKAVKNLEQFCEQLLESNVDSQYPDDWCHQIKQLHDKINQALKHNNQVLGHRYTTNNAIPDNQSSDDNKIILVDDDELLAALIQEQVKHFGFQISCIHNPEELSDFLDSNEPEVILMDIVFPNYDFNGIDLVKQLKAQNKIHCPIIFLSNREDFSARLEAVRSGGSGYLVKPVNILELVELLDKNSHKDNNEKFRALIIDDDFKMTRLYGKILETYDFICKGVTEPLTILEELKSFLPDIILLDVHMPDCNGFEVANVIRQDNRFTHIPILFLSADDSEECEMDALKAGGNCLLDKNTDTKTFIANAISQSRRSRELHAVIGRLRKDELRFQAVSHFSSDAIITLNKDGLIILWNEGAENIFGYRSLEVIGQSIELIIPKESQEKHRKGFQNLVSDENAAVKQSIESQACTKDGRLIHIELSYSEWLSGSERFFTSVIRDISQRKEIEETLLQQQENLKAIVTNSAEGIITIDDKGIIEMANPQALKIFSYTAAELEGQNVSVLMPKDLRHQHNQYLEKSEIHAAKIINKARELQGVRKDGSVFPMELNVSPMLINGVKKFVGILHDITERKHVVEAITNARHEAETANKAKSQFLSSMSHELRTPLNAVLGFSQLLQEDKQAPLNEDQLDSLSHIYTAGHHLLNLIDEVLDLSKVESGAIDINIESVDLITLLKRSLESITPQLLKAQLKLDQRLIDESVVFVKADAFRLKQVLSNLLSNAIKYNKEHGFVSVFLTRKDNKVRIYVKDEGVGIPENMMDDLFIPFNRLGAEQSEIEGTGIGLTITKMLVEMMGGSIGVDNIPGQGCAFWVELDETERPANINITRVFDKTSIKQSHDINILYIEDNPANRLLMKKIITSQTDFHYSEAITGDEGIAIALNIKPQIILLDINLPDMDGYEVFRQLQLNNITDTAKIIIVSANAMPADIDKSKNMDCFDYITKPIDQRKLIETVNRALS